MKREYGTLTGSWFAALIFSIVTVSLPAFATTHVVTFVCCEYTPSFFQAVVGDTVEWQGSFAEHPLQSTTIPPGATAFGNSSGLSYSYVIPVLGTYNYHCTLHQPVMAGSFDVADGGLVGTKTIDNTLPTGGDNYASFTDAITALNAEGVGNGGVTFNVTAGQIFTESPPEITATGTASNQIIFQKNGVAPNPAIVPATPGIVASSTTLGNHGDGILIINGGDDITFDGIDLQTDPTFTGNGMMEYGYYLKKASGTDACKNITIRNCSITLNKAAIYSFGIFVSNISGTTAVTVTSTGGRSETIRLYGNTISNAYGGIQLRGFNHTLAPYDFYDTNIEVGASGNGNSVSDYGGGATIVYALYAIHQDSLYVRNNVIMGGDGTTTNSGHYGLFVSTATNSDIDIDGNTFALVSHSTTGQVTAISMQTGSTAGTTNTHNVTNNSITIDRPSTTSGTTYVIQFTSNLPVTLNVSNNTIENMTVPGTGIIRGIYQISSPQFIFFRNNIIRNITRTGTTSGSALDGISNSTISGGNTEISGNTIHSLTSAGGGGGVIGIDASTASEYRIFNNNVHDLSVGTGSGAVFGIRRLAATPATYIYNNFISDLRTPNATSAHAVIGLNIVTTTAGNYFGVFHNTIFLNATSTSAASFGTSGIFANTGPTVDLRNNIVVNLSGPGPTGGGTVAYRRSSATLTTYANESDNNAFFVDTTAGVRRYFYGEGTTAGVANADSTFAAYQTRVAPRDASSIAENPPFVNATTPPYDLHIDSTATTQLDGGGTPVTSPIAVTEDFDGDPRDPTAPDIGADEFGGTSLVTVCFPVSGGWNLVSLPVRDPIPDDSVKHLFPCSINPYAFAFTGGYVQRFTMEPGKGYWVKCSSTGTVCITGTPIDTLTIPVASGWNMIGSISTSIDTSAACVTPSPANLRGSNFFRYNSGYSIAAMIDPGSGYWVKANGAGSFFMDVTCLAGKSSGQDEAAAGLVESLNRLIIQDASGGSQTLYFGADGANEIPVAMFAMPPAPPVGSFDARFESAEGGLMVQTHADEVHAVIEFPITVQSSAYPLTVSWKLNGAGSTYELSDGATSHQVRGEGALKITNSSVQQLVLKVTRSGVLPEEFALMQNYPNPFNPTTNIRFALPVESKVTVEIFNVLGQKVKTLLNEQRGAGYHVIEWNGTGVSGQLLGSGVYFVRLKAQSGSSPTFTNVRKLVFLK